MRGTKRKAANAAVSGPTTAVIAVPTAAPTAECDMASKKAAGGTRCCVECGATSTPQWREGPLGPKTLCNACGVRRQRQLRRQQQLATEAQQVAAAVAKPPHQSRRRLAELTQQAHALLHEAVSGESSDETELSWGAQTTAATPTSSHAHSRNHAPAGHGHVLRQHRRPPATFEISYTKQYNNSSSRYSSHMQPPQQQASDAVPAEPAPQRAVCKQPAPAALPRAACYATSLADEDSEEHSAACDLLFFAGVDYEAQLEGLRKRRRATGSCDSSHPLSEDEHGEVRAETSTAAPCSCPPPACVSSKLEPSASASWGCSPMAQAVHAPPPVHHMPFDPAMGAALQEQLRAAMARACFDFHQAAASMSLAAGGPQLQHLLPPLVAPLPLFAAAPAASAGMPRVQVQQPATSVPAAPAVTAST